LPATPDKVSRKEYSSIRNYVEIFSPSPSGNGRSGVDHPQQPIARAKQRDGRAQISTKNG